MEAKYKQIKESDVEKLSSEQDGQQYIKASLNLDYTIILAQ